MNSSPSTFSACDLAGARGRARGGRRRRSRCRGARAGAGSRPRACRAARRAARRRCGASLIRYGVAAIVIAGWETASSVPVRSVIAPRRAGTIRSASCWVAAACLSVPALTTPSQAARAAPMTSSDRKTAKSSPIRRSISFISAGRGRRGAGVRWPVRGGRERLGRRGRGGRGRDRRRGRDGGGRASGAAAGVAAVSGTTGVTVLGARAAGAWPPLAITCLASSLGDCMRSRGQARVDAGARGEVADVAGRRGDHALARRRRAGSARRRTGARPRSRARR